LINAGHKNIVGACSEIFLPFQTATLALLPCSVLGSGFELKGQICSIAADLGAVASFQIPTASLLIILPGLKFLPGSLIPFSNSLEAKLPSAFSTVSVFGVSPFSSSAAVQFASQEGSSELPCLSAS